MDEAGFASDSCGAEGEIVREFDGKAGLQFQNLSAGEWPMLSKCANPNCSNLFRYLNQGKLFRWDGLIKAEHRLSLVNNVARKSVSATEFYWLCQDCSTQMTVVYREGIGVTVRPIAARKAAS